MPSGDFIYEPAEGSATPDPTITAIYQKIGLPAIVGGVVISTNTLVVLSPYLALIGLIATTVAVAVRKHRK